MVKYVQGGQIYLETQNGKITRPYKLKNIVKVIESAAVSTEHPEVTRERGNSDIYSVNFAISALENSYRNFLSLECDESNKVEFKERYMWLIDHLEGIRSSLEEGMKRYEDAME